MGLSLVKGNSGYIGLDKRGEVASTGTTGSVSVRKHYLERKRGNFAPISPTPSNILQLLVLALSGVKQNPSIPI